MSVMLPTEFATTIRHSLAVDQVQISGYLRLDRDAAWDERFPIPGRTEEEGVAFPDPFIFGANDAQHPVFVQRQYRLVIEVMKLSNSLFTRLTSVLRVGLRHGKMRIQIERHSTDGFKGRG